MFSSSSIDPVARFKSMATPTVSRDGIVAALNSKPADQKGAVVDFLTKNSTLTEDEASPIAEAAVKAGGGDASKTADNVMTSLGGFSGDSLSLSDPVMLWPWARATAAVVLLAISVLAAVFIFGRHLTSNDYNVPLAVIAVAALLAALILVMGYKNVTISKGSGSGSAGATGAKTGGTPQPNVGGGTQPS
jgi:hypothetical protein